MAKKSRQKAVGNTATSSATAATGSAALTESEIRECVERFLGTASAAGAGQASAQYRRKLPVGEVHKIPLEEVKNVRREIESLGTAIYDEFTHKRLDTEVAKLRDPEVAKLPAPEVASNAVENLGDPGDYLGYLINDPGFRDTVVELITQQVLATQQAVIADQQLQALLGAQAQALRTQRSA